MRNNFLTTAIQAARPGLALEFGVADGSTLRHIAAARPRQTYGFDSFQGLPEDWREGFPAGRFRTSPPRIPDATLIIGLFADTLPPWLEQHPVETIGFVHIDCDLYSSTATVLDHMHRLQPGTVIAFDELIGYPGWQHHEHKALLEYVASSGRILEPVAAEGERAAFVIT